MENIVFYFEMGGHGSYIWVAYSMVFFVLLALWIQSKRFALNSQSELARLAVDRPNRQLDEKNEA
jgi:heme exporter protein CcmD